MITFLKNKKTLFLFFFTFFILAPKIAEGFGFLEVCTWQEWLTFPATTFQCALAWLFTAIIKASSILIYAIFAIPSIILTIIFSIIINLLVLGLPSLLSVPVLGAPIVVEMWSFVRDFANMFFILFFVVIGLSTILNIEKYKYQKTLPLLIIMALLINFSLILVGFIVDVGNILTVIFLEPVRQGMGAFGNLLNFSNNVPGGGIAAIWNASWADPVHSLTVAVGHISYVLSLAGMYFFVILVLFIIWFIFAFRIAILWMLAILAPLAFVSYVFEVTKSAVWNKWLSNLIKWAMVPVPILFFMFIALQVLHSAPAEIGQITAGLSPDQISGGRITAMITAFITPLISLLIMFLGVIISMTTLPEGAQAAINAGQKTGSWVINAGKDSARRNPTYNNLEGIIRRGFESNAAMRMFTGKKEGEYISELKKEKEEHKKRYQAEKLDNIRFNKSDTPAETAGKMEARGEKGGLTYKEYNDNINKAKLGGVSTASVHSNVPLAVESDDDFQRDIMSKRTEVTSKADISTWDDQSGDPIKQKRQVDLLAGLVMGNPAKEIRGLTSSQKSAIRGALNRERVAIVKEVNSKMPKGRGGSKRIQKLDLHLV